MAATANIGRYRVLNRLAAGGMGELFLARHEGPADFTKLVVVKRMLPHLARDAGFVKMFIAEAKLAALIHHPNVVQIFELGEHEGTWFIAMEPVFGHTLRAVSDRLKEQGRTFPLQQLGRICAQVLHGLHHAHQLKSDSGEPLHLVHRDVSPENVMVGFNGGVKLLDFGVAKAATGAAESSASGAQKGKLAYMSPEQVRGQPIDARTDVWAAGVMMYELLAGHRPFAAMSELETGRLICEQAPAPLDQAAPGTPDALVAIVHRALEKSPARRFATAEQMARALETWVEAQRTSLTNSQTSAFMRELYGAEAEQVLASVSSSGRLAESKGPAAGGDIYLSSIRAGGDDEAKQGRSARRRAVMFGLTAVLTLGGAVGGALAAFTPAEGAVVRVPAAEPKAVVAAAPDSGPAPAPAAVEAEDTATRPPPEDAPPLEAKVRKKGFGTVELQVSPWAEVYEGRRRLGVTPMNAFELPPGRHVLTLKNSELGLTRQVTAKVAKRGRVSLNVHLDE